VASPTEKVYIFVFTRYFTGGDKPRPYIVIVVRLTLQGKDEMENQKCIKIIDICFLLY